MSMLDLGGVQIKHWNTIISNQQASKLVGTFVHSFTQVSRVLRSEIMLWFHRETQSVPLPSKDACDKQLRGGFIIAAIPRLVIEELDVAEEVAVHLGVDEKVAEAWQTLADALAVITSMFTK